MKQCIVYHPIAGSRRAWVRCARRAEARSRFCRRHGELVIGTVLGMYANGMLDKLQSVASESQGTVTGESRCA